MHIVRMRQWLADELDKLAPQGKSRAGLARALGCAESRVSEMISGKRKQLRAREVEGIALYLDWSAQHVLHLERGGAEVNDSVTSGDETPPPDKGSATGATRMNELEIIEDRVCTLLADYDIKLVGRIMDRAFKRLAAAQVGGNSRPRKRA